ncbi:unnamed protein product, partial [Adineta ricciae]
MLTIGIILLILQFNIAVFAQGLFDPSSFTESSCSGNNQWTTWFDSSDPSSSQGDFEVTNHLQQNFPLFMCPTPIAVEAQTITGASPVQTGDLFRLTLKDGFLCLNQQTSIGQTTSATVATPRPTTTPLIPTTNTCGRQSITPATQRIVGGVEAIPHSWPWIVSLQVRDHF